MKREKMYELSKKKAHESMILLHLIILMDTSLLLWRYEKTQKEKTYCQRQIPQIKLQVVVIYNNMMHLFRLCVVEHLPFVGYFTATHKCSQHTHTLFYLNTERVFRTRALLHTQTYPTVYIIYQVKETERTTDTRPKYRAKKNLNSIREII